MKFRASQLKSQAEGDLKGAGGRCRKKNRMKDTQLYEQMLGITKPWEVTGIQLDVGVKKVEVRLACTEQTWWGNVEGERHSRAEAPTVAPLLVGGGAPDHGPGGRKARRLIAECEDMLTRIVGLSRTPPSPGSVDNRSPTPKDEPHFRASFPIGSDAKDFGALAER